PEVPREGAAQTLQERRGPGRRPPPVPPGRTRPRPSVRAAGARPAVGAAFAGPGRDDGGGRASAGGLRGRAERGDRAAPEGTGPVARVGGAAEKGDGGGGPGGGPGQRPLHPFGPEGFRRPGRPAVAGDLRGRRSTARASPACGGRLDRP